jgi:hypothetical protein
MTSEHNDDIVATNKAWYGKIGKSHIVIQFSMSDPVLNCIVHLMSDHVISGEVLHYLIIVQLSLLLQDEFFKNILLSLW